MAGRHTWVEERGGVRCAQCDLFYAVLGPRWEDMDLMLLLTVGECPLAGRPTDG